jgi:hypothetical protein
MRITNVTKTNPLGFRVEPEIKAAIEKAAADDDRSVSSLIERILKEWLMRRGYLPKVTLRKKGK